MITGTIYKIIIGNDTYVGSTTKRLCERQAQHNYDYRNGKDWLLYQKAKDFSIEKIVCMLVEIVEVDSLTELRKIEEGVRMRIGACLNMRKCYESEEEKRVRNKKYKQDALKSDGDALRKKWREYYHKNKEKELAKQGRYRARNRENIRMYKAKYNKIKVACDNCDKVVCRNHMARHKRSQYCKKFRGDII